ncbi:MAG TPA: ketopantoate reductase family protein [Rhodanobacteraceae bacterium]|nr:ketopantoate reductase family protein [Rhodanobacteraceae bacterium]
MKWLVLGAGALGGYFGGRLVEAGEDVAFLVRARRHGQLRQAGLVIRSPMGDVHVAAPACVEAGAPGADYDVVLLGCKAYDLDSAMDAIAPAVGANTAVLPLLNGLSHIDRLRERFGAARVLGGMCQISAALDETGAIVHFNRLDTLAWGELDRTRGMRVEAIEAAFARCHFTARTSPDILQEMWEKWIFIAAMAGVTCLFRAAIGDIVHADGTEVATGILDEGVAIAAAAGHAPRAAQLEQMRKFLTRPDSTLTASMLKDVERGARTEGEHILGELLGRAPTAAPAPRLLALAAIALQAYEVRRVREAAAR